VAAAEVVAATRAAGAARLGSHPRPPSAGTTRHRHFVGCPSAARSRHARDEARGRTRSIPRTHAGLRAIALRYFTVYGPRQRPDLAIHAFTRALTAGEPVTLFGSGDTARDYTYCDDVIAGTVAALDWTSDAPVGLETVNLGGNEVITLAAMLASVARAVGVDPDVRHAPAQPGDVRTTSADLAKAARLLAYRPRVAFTEGIRRFVDWYRGSHERQL
jgi:UDP-glucuronate 4-epimerase